MTDLTLVASRTIKAPAKQIYDAWIDPNMLAKFMRPGPDMTVPKATVDARKGGRFAITMRSGEQDIPHAGTYLELSPYSRIVFTWESPFSFEGSTVTIDLAAKGDATEVTLTHVKFSDETSRDNHAKGWEGILAGLAETLG